MNPGARTRSAPGSSLLQFLNLPRIASLLLGVAARYTVTRRNTRRKALASLVDAKEYLGFAGSFCVVEVRARVLNLTMDSEPTHACSQVGFWSAVFSRPGKRLTQNARDGKRSTGLWMAPATPVLAEAAHLCAVKVVARCSTQDAASQLERKSNLPPATRGRGQIGRLACGLGKRPATEQRPCKQSRGMPELRSFHQRTSCMLLNAVGAMHRLDAARSWRRFRAGSRAASGVGSGTRGCVQQRGTWLVPEFGERSGCVAERAAGERSLDKPRFAV